MQRMFALTVMVFVVAAATFWGRLQSQSTARKPYTAWIETQHFIPGSTEPPSRLELLHAVRADGSSLRESRWAGDPHPTQELVLTAEAKVYAMDRATRSYTEAPLRPESIQNRRAPVQSSCESVFGKCQPAEPLLGYSTYLVEISPPGSSRTTKQWVTPALAWAAMREETWRHGTLTAVSTVTRVVEGEPPDALFHIPAEYRKVDAGQQLTGSGKARGVAVDSATVEAIRQRIDDPRRRSGQ